MARRDEADTDDETMTTTARKDLDDFVALVERCDRGLRALAYRLLGDPDVMDDVLQEAYVKAYRSLGSFRGSADPGTWLYRITYNACIDELRRRRRVTTLPLEEGLARASGDDPAARASDRRDLAAALDALPPDQRAALLLVDAEGMSYAEAGEVLGVPAGTVGRRLHEARAAARRALRGTEDP